MKTKCLRMLCVLCRGASRSGSFVVFHGIYSASFFDSAILLFQLLYHSFPFCFFPPHCCFSLQVLSSLYYSGTFCFLSLFAASLWIKRENKIGAALVFVVRVWLFSFHALGRRQKDRPIFEQQLLLLFFFLPYDCTFCCPYDKLWIVATRLFFHLVDRYIRPPSG